MLSRNQTDNNINELLNIILAFISAITKVWSLAPPAASWTAGSWRLQAHLPGSQCLSTPPAPQLCDPSGLKTRMLLAALTLLRGGRFLQAIHNTGPAEAGRTKLRTPSWPFLFLEGNSGCSEEGYAATETDRALSSPAEAPLTAPRSLPPLTHRPGQDGSGAFPADAFPRA